MKDRYAALDLGSNSFHLVIAQMLDGSIQTVDKNKHMVRLGEGLDDNNRLSGEAIARGIEALTQMGQLVADIPEDQFRAVATNTLRVAENRDAFIAAGEAALGKPIIGLYRQDPQNYANWHPKSDQAQIIWFQQHIQEITPAQMIAALRNIIPTPQKAALPLCPNL